MKENKEAQDIRLNKYLSEMGICSRREADRLMEKGCVLVDGKPAAMGARVSPGQRVVCNGTIIGEESGREKKRPGPVLLAVNKPRGVVCTTSDKDRAMNIVELVKYPERVYPVGRLDKDSEGLIFMTNQGDLVNKIMRSSNTHEKEYLVTVNKPLSPEFLKNMRKGVWLKELDVMTKPCQVEPVGKQEFRIILTQGLNRQIRRMCQALQYRVLELKRVRILNVKLGNLKTGTYRRVTLEEYEELIKLLESSTSLSYAESQKKEYCKHGRK